MNRRQVLIGGGMAALAVATTGCPGAKNLSFYVSTVVGALKDLSPLIPNLGPTIAKAIKIAEDFDEAYRKGAFENAMALFENLAGLVSQITESAGVDNQQVKLAIAVASIALRTIAVLLKTQADNPEVAAVISGKHTSASVKRQVSLVERLADTAAVDTAFKAAKL